MAKGQEICERTKKNIISLLRKDVKADPEVIEAIEGFSCSKGAKRAPSSYNLHIGECMRAGNSMKDCAASWKTQKG